MKSSPTTESLLQVVEEIRPVLEENRAQNEVERRLSDASYDAMRNAGFFRMLVPREFGGMELHPVEAYKVWEAIAKIDSAAAWNLLMAFGIAGMVAWLPEKGVREILGNTPDVHASGGFFPPAKAVAVNGGWRVTGRTPFASGCHQAQWLMMPSLIMEEDKPKMDPETGGPVMLVTFFPHEDAKIIDTWHTMGMRGTFSSDVSINDLFVPAHRTGILKSLTDPPAAMSNPLYRLWFWPPVHGEASVSLGIAGAAIEKLITLAKTKTPAMTMKALRDKEMAQHHAAKATALVDAARAYLHKSITEAYEEVAKHQKLSEDAKIRCQLAACFTAEACAQAVDLVHEAAGSSGIRIEAGFERHFRDIHTLTQHASKSYARYESAGKMLFGLPTDWFALGL